jgi:protein TonB
MDFSQQQQGGRRFVGFGVVVLLHLLLGYALLSGLARQVVDVVKGPIEVKVIEEIVKPPPPPPEVLPPPPKVAAPPPPFIPPPEINIAPPPTPAPTITAVTPDAPPAPTAPVIAKPVENAPPAPPPPAIRSAAVECPNYREVIMSVPYPRDALLEGLEGTVLIEFTVSANGQIRDPVIRSSSNRIFNRPALSSVTRLNCPGKGQDIRVQIPVDFKIK